jgi:hypothetical protein
MLVFWDNTNELCLPARTSCRSPVLCKFIMLQGLDHGRDNESTADTDADHQDNFHGHWYFQIKEPNEYSNRIRVGTLIQDF